MVSAVHHVTVVPTDSDQLSRFLSDALGLQVVSRQVVEAENLGPLFAGTDVSRVVSTMHGRAAAGMIEVLAFDGVRDGRSTSAAERRSTAGIVSLSFAVEDVGAVVALAVSHGCEDAVRPSLVRFGDLEVLVASLEIAGVTLQLTQVVRQASS